MDKYVNSVKMRFIDSLCPPALLYLLFITIQIALDVSFGLFTLAAGKVGVGLIVVYLLNALCGVDLGIVSWAIVATPFIITALATSIALGQIVSQEEFTLSPRSDKDADDVVVTMAEPVDYPFSTSAPYSA